MACKSTSIYERIKIWVFPDLQPQFHFINVILLCTLSNVRGKGLESASHKCDFKGPSGTDYGTHGLKQSHKLQYSIRLNFRTWRFCQKLCGVSSRGQQVRFFHLIRGGGWISFFRQRFFQPIKMNLETYHDFNKMKLW